MAFELARKWVQHGHHVTVFTSDQHDTERRFSATREQYEGIHVHRFKNPSHWLATRWSFLFFYPLGLRAALRKAGEQFDVVHVAESRGRHNRWVARELGSGVMPVAWSAYGGLAEGEGARRVYRRMHDWWFNTRKTVRQSAALIAQTSHEAQVYASFGARPEQISQIPLAINWSDFAVIPDRGQFRRKFGISESEKLVLFLGRVHSTKGLQVLIPAFASAIRRHPEARLAVVGWDHGFLPNAKKLAAELGLDSRVIFAGSVYGPERLQAYVDADVFALTPGTYEETSLAALEACACSAACVITRQCEIPGLEASGAGVITDYSSDSVAAALHLALTGTTAKTWGINGRRMIQTRFTTDAVARMHEELFTRLAAERHKA
jgi:glycosyltransferase involved in cell wall biosynthesis